MKLLPTDEQAEKWKHIEEWLEFACEPDYLHKCIGFAVVNGKIDSLIEGLHHIANLAKNHGQKGRVMSDFAPYSFTWSAFGMFGGLIFHGSHDRGGDGGAPTFSVSLSPHDGWSIHT